MSDEDKIIAEVERRKQRARDLGLLKITFQFYREYAQHYPAWKDTQPEVVPRLITNIQELPEDGVEFRYQDVRYTLKWKEHSNIMPDGELFLDATLSLLVNGNLVFEVNVDGEYKEYIGTVWKPFDVEAFIEGPWVFPFKAFAAEAEQLYTIACQRWEQKRRDEKTADLKSRFGIKDED